MLCVVDEFTREALAIRVDRRLSSADVIETVAELMLERGTPAHIRSDNGPEFVEGCQELDLGRRQQHRRHRTRITLENGYVESFNSKLRDELLNGEIFYSLKEAQILIEAWRRHYNGIRPHSALGWRPPAPEVRVAAPLTWPA